MLCDLRLSRRKSELLLAAVIVARATSYMFSKILLQTKGQFTILGTRSAIAFLLLLLIFHKELGKTTRKDFLYGFLAGFSFFCVTTLELTALRHTTSVSVSLEENTALIFVPIIMSVLTRKLPDHKTTIATVLAALGVFLLNFKPGGFAPGIGDLFGMAAAFTYALTIVLLAKVSGKANPVRIGIFQVGTMAFCALAAAFLLETPALPSGGREWAYMLYLAIVCSGFGFTLQPLAQRGTSAETAGRMCALNPVTAMVLGALFLSETLTGRRIAGALLILAGIIL